MEELNKLYEVIKQRKESPEEGSYTTYLFNKGKEKILKKVGEEATEVVISALGNSKDEQVNETCDLLYHVIVIMVELGIPLEDVDRELKNRTNKTHNLKAERKSIEKL